MNQLWPVHEILVSNKGNLIFRNIDNQVSRGMANTKVIELYQVLSNPYIQFFTEGN